MTKTILGIFTDRENTEKAIDRLRSEGFNPKDISIVMKDTREAEDIGDNTGANVTGGALAGATTGAAVGGVAGFLAGTLMPGLAGFLIAGPIGTALGLTGAAATTVSGAATGAVAGGLIGGLMGLGLSQEDAERYQSRVNEGAILLAVPATDKDQDIVTRVFDNYHASDINIVSQSTDEDISRRRRTDAFYDDQYQFAGAKGGESSTVDKADYNEKPTGKKGGLGSYPTPYDDTYSQSSGYANPVQVQKYLKGIDYPCSRRDLVEVAEEHDADANVLRTLSSLHRDRFNGPDDVAEAIGEL